MKLRSLLFGATFTVVALSAQPPSPQDPSDNGQFGNDPPSRVARLNLINGQVSFQPASLDTWTSATLNYPLTTGDHLYTDTASRAELHIGPNAVRLNGQTNFGFLNLDDQTVQMRFTEGAIEVRIRALGDQDAYEIDTPNGAISLLRTGDYRVDTDPDRNATMVTVFSGDVEVTVNGNSFAVHPRQTAYFSEGGAPDIRGANPSDDFDRFTGDRNAREERLPRPQHVSSNMVGYEDLNNYGEWQETPDYGWAWAPPVQVGWVPYHDGHWAWVEPWGWTWIDEAPWGFAPFHYGRWALVRARWLWIPGAVAVRPVYAPALVAFVGGPRFSVGIGVGGGIGAVAWFPLGPREVYRPVYHVSDRYVRNVNVTNVNVTNINVTNVRYMNQNVPGAVTGVPQNAFANARPVRETGFRVTPQQMAQAQVVGAAPQVAPQRESLLAGGRANVNVPRPRDSAISRPVIGKVAPPPAPIAFQARQQVLAQNQGRPLAPEQVNQLRQQQPASVVNRMPFRSAAAPTPPSNGAPQIQPAQPIPNRGGFQSGQGGNQPQGRPADRFESRPPGARPFPPNAGAANNQPGPNQPVPNQPGPNQPVPNQPAVGGRSGFNRPAPDARPGSENSPAPNRPGFGRPQQAAPPAQVQAPENRPAVPERRREFAPPPQANQPQPNQPQPNVNRPAPENRPNFNRPPVQAPAPRPNVAAPAPPPNRPAPPPREGPRREGDRRDDRRQN